MHLQLDKTHDPDKACLSLYTHTKGVIASLATVCIESYFRLKDEVLINRVSYSSSEMRSTGGPSIMSDLSSKVPEYNCRKIEWHKYCC
jgi:hypothetical protein